MLTHLLLAQIIVCAAMTGIIWLVQRMIYPQFLMIEKANFEEFHHRYTSALSFVVAPFMITEMGLAGISLLFDHSILMWLGFGIVILLWFSTFFIQVPIHAKLSHGWDQERIKTLIRSNWLRTILWNSRLVLLVIAFLQLS